MVFPAMGLFILIWLLVRVIWFIENRYASTHRVFHEVSTRGCVLDAKWAKVISKFSNVMNMYQLQNNLKWSLLLCLLIFLMGILFIFRTYTRNK